MKPILKWVIALVIVVIGSVLLDSCAMSKEDIHARKVKNGIKYTALKKKNDRVLKQNRRRCKRLKNNLR